jgi:hypothetical protein
MNLHALTQQPSPTLARALAEFESRFTYPLGPGRSFRISHGEDYPRFFRAMGRATCFVAERNGGVLGVVAVAIRPLIMPDGSRRQAAYIGDLKVDPSVRGTLVFLKLARAAEAWARPQVVAAYGVVMDGTATTPAGYTGRAGIPSFLQLGKIFVLRIPAKAEGAEGESRWIASAQRGEECYYELSRGRYAAAGGTPGDRSESVPHWLVHPEGLACGRLEDTRNAKRLIDSDGVEMVSAHLASFAYRTPDAGAGLIHAARSHTAQRGMPALFVAVAEADLATLQEALGPVDQVVAPATVYGVGLRSGPAWNINSSEI